MIEIKCNHCDGTGTKNNIIGSSGSYETHCDRCSGVGKLYYPLVCPVVVNTYNKIVDNQHVVKYSDESRLFASFQGHDAKENAELFLDAWKRKSIMEYIERNKKKIEK